MSVGLISTRTSTPLLLRQAGTYYVYAWRSNEVAQKRLIVYEADG